MVGESVSSVDMDVYVGVGVGVGVPVLSGICGVRRAVQWWNL